VVNDLERVKEVRIMTGDKEVTLRTELKGDAGNCRGSRPSNCKGEDKRRAYSQLIAGRQGQIIKNHSATLVL